MKLYALVGGTAAGKSTVARRIARRYGGHWLEADRVGHQVLQLQRVRQRLLALFGPGIVGPDGAIDRRRLGRRVFGDPARLAALDRVVHPEIALRVRRRIAAYERRGAAFVLLDAALFFEIALGQPVDGVLAVTAPRAVRRQRLRDRGRWTPAEIDARLASQPRVAAWARLADVRLVNDSDRRTLDARIDVAWKALRRVRTRRRRGRGRT
jgi:dephospho-CoA kinase